MSYADRRKNDESITPVRIFVAVHMTESEQAPPCPVGRNILDHLILQASVRLSERVLRSLKMRREAETFLGEKRVEMEMIPAGVILVVCGS